MERLLYITNTRIPNEQANGLQIMKMCGEFARKFEVELIVPWRIQTRLMNQITDIYEYFKVERKFKVSRLFSLNFTPPWDSRFSYWTRTAQSILHWPQCLFFGLISAFYSLFRPAKLVYSRDLFSCLFLYFFKPLHNKRIFYEAHDFPLTGAGSKLRCWTLRHVDGLVVISSKLAEVYQRNGIPAEAILVAPDGVDLALFPADMPKEKIRKELRITNDKRIVCYTGHLYRWKGVNVLVQAMKRLVDECLLYVIGGTPRDVIKFQEFISSNQISNVVLVGYVPPTQIPEYLAAADILVLPNTSEEAISRLYTSPLKLFEYMAAHRPIIASDLPSIREILDEENALLVKPDDPEALADGIRKALEDEKMSQRLANKALRNVQLYTWEKRADKIMAFIGTKKVKQN